MKRFSLTWKSNWVFVAVVSALLLVAAVPDVNSVSTAVAQNSKTNGSKRKNAKPANKSAKNSGKKSGVKSATKSSSANSRKGDAKSQKSTRRRSATRQQKKQDIPPKSSAEAKRLQEAAQKEIQQTKERLRLNEQEIKTGLSDLNRLSSEIAVGRTQVAGLEKKVSSLNSEITSLGNEISNNEAELKLMREEYLKAVKKMRLTKKNQSTLAFIFASENFNQAMRRLRYLREFSAWKEKKSSDIDEKIRSLGEERNRLAEVKDAQTVALGQLNKSQAELKEKHGKQEALVARLRQNGDALQAHLVAKQNEANRLKETIASLIAQEQAKAEAERKAREKAEAERIAREKAEAERKAREKAEAERLAAEKESAEAAQKEADEKKSAGNLSKEEKPSKKDKSSKRDKEDKKKNSEKGSRSKKDREDRKDRKEKAEYNVQPAEKTSEPISSVSGSPVNFVGLRGSLPRPVDGAWRITNAFGRHSMPELPEVVYDNPGIDAEVATGASVKSVCGGKVSGVYKVAGYGTVVIVNHGEYYTVYGNLSSANVAVGSQVNMGQTLGSAGNDPDDPRRGSVHFEVWKGREKQNPSEWIR